MVPTDSNDLIDICLTLSIIMMAVSITAGYFIGRRDGSYFAYTRRSDAAKETLEEELRETAQRLTSAERILTATQAELRRTQDDRNADRRNAAEAIEELTLRLDAVKSLNAGNATTLRQSANFLETTASTWKSMGATTKARHASILSDQLHDIAATLDQDTQEAAA